MFVPPGSTMVEPLYCKIGDGPVPVLTKSRFQTPAGQLVPKLVIVAEPVRNTKALLPAAHRSVVAADAAFICAPPPTCGVSRWFVESTNQRLIQAAPSHCCTKPVEVFHHNMPLVGEPGAEPPAKRLSAAP